MDWNTYIYIYKKKIKRLSCGSLLKINHSQTTLHTWSLSKKHILTTVQNSNFSGVREYHSITSIINLFRCDILNKNSMLSISMYLNFKPFLPTTPKYVHMTAISFRQVLKSFINCRHLKWYKSSQLGTLQLWNSSPNISAVSVFAVTIIIDSWAVVI